MSVNLSLFAGAGWQFFDNNGVPLAGGLIYTYAAGTTTPQATYTSSSGSIAQSNPIVLNSAGRVSVGEVWVSEGLSYKFVLKDSTGTTIGTYDNINGTYVAADLANTTDPTLGDALVGFRQSNASGNLTGAVGRTVHQKLQELISVKDFGATGDGTTDDSAALQAAITAAAGATLYIPEGTYYYTSLLTVSNSMNITGDGYGSQLKPYAPSGNNIRINASNVMIENIRMEGTAPVGFAIGVSGAVTNITFQNCFFKTVEQVIYLYTANDITIQNCVFDTTGYGVIQNVGYVSSFVLIDNNIAKNMTADFVEANCESGSPSEAWTISNNIFEGSNGYPTAATEQRFVGITSVKNCIITGNNIKKCCGDAAIHLENTLGNTIISNNIFDNCVVSGGNSGYIYLLNSAENVAIENNMFFRTDASLGSANVIGTSSNSYTNDIQFIGNRVEGAGPSGNFGGLEYAFQNGQLTCVGNHFESLTSAISFISANNVIFANNYLFNCNDGLKLAQSATSGGGDNWLIANNVFQVTAGTYDIFTAQNTNGTTAPQNWTVNGNVFSKSVTVTGQPGGTGTQAANDIVITNNVFQSGASLSTTGTMPRRVLFGNVFQDSTLSTITTTAPDLPNYANDAAAAAGGIIVGGMYRNGSVIQVRVT